MRNYMNRKRRVNHIAKLEKEKIKLQKVYKEHPEIKYLDPEGWHMKGINQQITDLNQGLLELDKKVPK